jgi:Domain of unknown function (DUF932)
MQVLNLDLLKSAPAALATARNITTTSDKYNFISTVEVLEALIQDNWQIVGAKQSRSRSRDLFARHEITLSDPSLQITQKVGDIRPQFYLSNAHDGSATYTMRAGLEVKVCMNGLYVPEGLCQAVSIKHLGSRTIEEVVEVAQAYRSNVDLIGENIRRFQEVELTPAAAVAFVQQAAKLRHNEEGIVVAPESLLAVQRSEDVGFSLWKTFNRAQEWLVRGGYEVTKQLDNNRTVSRKARPIRAILESARINTKLWELAELFSKN